MENFPEFLQVGDWITWNFGICLVSAKVKSIKRTFFFQKEYEVECWAIDEKHRTCHSFPRSKITQKEYNDLRLYRFLRTPFL